MANRAASKRREVRHDYASDRLFAIKLQQAYELVVPDRVRVASERSIKDTVMKIAALYARVSSDQQKHDNTITSQTAALLNFASSHDYHVPEDLVFQDEGYSGASLERSGLERVRDLAAEGRLDAALVHAPDRLSRNYAYQVLLIEELARHGVDTVFANAPAMTTPEDRLLLQFQGMIAEYERAQILERSRRGKRHRACQGQVSVLCGAPYGYRYHKESERIPACCVRRPMTNAGSRSRRVAQ